MNFVPLKSFLDRREPVTIPCDGCKDAAIIVPLVPGRKLELLFTKRASHLARHAGEMSFPGGRVDPTDRSKLDAALRELAEEVGIPVAEVQVLGRLDDAVSSTNYHIEPYVCVIPHRDAYEYEKSEIEEIHRIELASFLKPPVEEVYGPDDDGKSSFVYRINGVTIFGVTASIVKGFMDIVAESGFVAENAEFIL